MPSALSSFTDASGWGRRLPRKGDSGFRTPRRRATVLEAESRFRILSIVMTVAIRWTASRWRAQLLLYLSAYAVYSSARWIAAGDPARAIDHSHWIAHLERAVHVGVEQPV